MIRFLFNALLAVLLFALFRSAFRGVKNYFYRPPRERPPQDGNRRSDGAYDDLTPYDVEDADVEDIGKTE